LKNIKAVGQELKLNMHVYGPEMHVSGIVPLALSGKKSDIKEFGEA
jgi:ATP citrate (pro-S)-lyase